MVQHVLDRLRPQVAEIVINANQNAATYAKFGHPVVADNIPGFAGPLAGLHAGMKAASNPLVVTVPCDSPFLPDDLVARLKSRLQGFDLAVAKTGDQPHPVFSLMRTDLLKNLQAFLVQGGRKIDAWYGSLKFVEVQFDDEADAFRNINTVEELKRE
jgi:molybdopterin-guanine dinucleotide biosynthesis protein A